MTAFAAALKPVQADAYAPAQEQFDSIKSRLRSAQAKGWTVSNLEEFLDVEGREMLRLFVQGYLDEQGPGSVAEPVVDSNGRQHTHQRFHSRSIVTLFGSVVVNRQGYGGRGLKSLHPLDAKLNLPPESYSHSLRRRSAEAASKESYGEVTDSIEKQTGVAIPKRQVEELARRAAQDFESFYRQQRSQNAREVKKTGKVLALTMDGKGVPMLKKDLREAIRKAAEEQKPKLEHRRSSGEKSNSKRMGTVAAVYTIDPFVRTPEQIVREFGPVRDALPRRPRPEDKRVWASIKHSPEIIVKQMFEEAMRRDPKKSKQWVALVDGNETQLGLLQCAAEEHEVELVTILDLIHVLEYLWKAAWSFHSVGSRAAEDWVGERLLRILRGESSAVAAGMTRSATLRGLSAKEREAVDRCAHYLLKYREFLRYDQYLAAGYPIATGVIEGACRYLVKDRMEITGARWSLAGAEAALQLRSLRASGDFDEYWEFHLRQEYQRHHQSRYEKGRVPVPKSESQGKTKIPHLKLVR